MVHKDWELEALEKLITDLRKTRSYINSNEYYPEPGMSTEGLCCSATERDWKESLSETIKRLVVITKNLGRSGEKKGGPL